MRNYNNSDGGRRGGGSSRDGGSRTFSLSPGRTKHVESKIDAETGQADGGRSPWARQKLSPETSPTSVSSSRRQSPPSPEERNDLTSTSAISVHRRDGRYPLPIAAGLGQTQGSLRGGYRSNHYVTMGAVGEDASSVLSIASQHMKQKTTEELKPFAVVEVEVSTVSMMDTLIRRDRFLRSPNLPYKMGCDMVGRVVQAGKGSTTYGISEGDRVCAVDFHLGGHSRYVVVPCYDLIKVPHKVESAQAVCLLRPYVTAYQCLHDAGDRSIIPGDRVLVCGGTGAVGQAVVELALAAGASAVYSTGRGAEIQKLLRAKGATVLAREPSQWLPVVEGRMDIVIDLVCSDGFSSSFKALRPDGTGKLICVGATSKQNKKGVMDNLVARTAMTMAAYFMPNTTIYDFFASLENDPEGYRRDVQDLFRLLKEKRISPRISKFVLLDEIVIAHEAIEKGGLNGNVICRPNPTSKFTYNGITKQKRKQSSGEARDDVSVSSVDESDSEDETDYSRSIMANISDDSALSGSYSTFDDESWGAYSESTTGTPAPATGGFLSSQIKNHQGRRNTHGAAHGAGVVTTLDAICEEGVDPQSGSISPKVLVKTNDGRNAISVGTSALLGVADRADTALGKDTPEEKDAWEKDQATSTGVDTNNGPSDKAANGTSRHWLKRIPSMSKTKKAAKEALSETRSVPSAASERVISHPVPQGNVPSSGGVPSKKSHDCGEDETNERIEANGTDAVPSVPSTPENDGAEEFLRYVASFFSTEEPSERNGVKEPVNKDISDLEEPVPRAAVEPTTSKRWLKRIPSMSKRKKATKDASSETRSVPPDASERFISRPVPKGKVASKLGVPSKKSHDCEKNETNERIEAGGTDAVPSAPSTPKNDGPEEFIRYMGSFFSTEEPSENNDTKEEAGKDTSDLEKSEQASTKRCGDATSILDKALSHLSIRESSVEENDNGNEDQKSATGSIGSAIQDLLGLHLCAKVDELEGKRPLDRPLHIVFRRDTPVEPDSDVSQLSSTLFSSDVVTTREVSPSQQKSKRMENDEMSVLTGTESAEPTSTPHDARTEKSLLPARIKGLRVSKTAVPLSGTSSVPSSRGRGGQGTHKSHVSLARSMSSVSIRCDSSQRQFHVPTAVASSVMSVSSSGASRGSATSRRNIYATRARPNRSSGRPKPKGVFKKK